MTFFRSKMTKPTPPPSEIFLKNHPFLKRQPSLISSSKMNTNSIQSKRWFKFQTQCPGFVVPLAMFTKGYLHACIVNYVSNNFSFWEIVPCQSSVWPKIMPEIVLEVNNLQDLLKWHMMWWYNPDITDVTLASDDQSIKAHKVILSACSS